MEPIARIDAALRRAVETNEVPGVVAMRRPSTRAHSERATSLAAPT